MNTVNNTLIIIWCTLLAVVSGYNRIQVGHLTEELEQVAYDHYVLETEYHCVVSDNEAACDFLEELIAFPEEGMKHMRKYR